MDPPIPEDVVALLRDRVVSLEHLEALLLLKRGPDRALSLHEMATRLGMPSAILEPTLAELVRNGLVAVDGIGDAARWQYAAATRELGSIVDRLEELCRERRLEIMRMLSAQAMDRIRNAAARAFSDAFVIRGKKDG